MSDYCMRCGVPHPGRTCGRDEAEERARVTAIVRDSLMDGARLGIGHAIGVVEDYADGHPEARPYCGDIVATLRRTVGEFGA